MDLKGFEEFRGHRLYINRCLFVFETPFLICLIYIYIYKLSSQIRLPGFPLIIPLLCHFQIKLLRNDLDVNFHQICTKGLLKCTTTLPYLIDCKGGINCKRVWGEILLDGNATLRMLPTFNF